MTRSIGVQPSNVCIACIDVLQQERRRLNRGQGGADLGRQKSVPRVAAAAIRVEVATGPVIAMTLQRTARATKLLRRLSTPPPGRGTPQGRRHRQGTPLGLRGPRPQRRRRRSLCTVAARAVYAVAVAVGQNGWAMVPLAAPAACIALWHRHGARVRATVLPSRLLALVPSPSAMLRGRRLFLPQVPVWLTGHPAERPQRVCRYALWLLLAPAPLLAVVGVCSDQLAADSAGPRRAVHHCLDAHHGV